MKTRVVYKVYWDNGVNACGVFPHQYPTEAEADAAAEAIYAQNIADGTWDATNDAAGTFSVREYVRLESR